MTGPQPRVLDLRRTESPEPGLPPTRRERPPGRYAIATFDDSGRITDRRLITRLGWTAGTSVRMHARDGVIVITASATGSNSLNNRAMLTIPWALRQWCGFHVREQVLLVAEPRLSSLYVLGVEIVDQALPDLAGLTDATDQDGADG